MFQKKIKNYTHGEIKALNTGDIIDNAENPEELCRLFTQLKSLEVKLEKECKKHKQGINYIIGLKWAHRNAADQETMQKAHELAKADYQEAKDFLLDVRHIASPLKTIFKAWFACRDLITSVPVILDITADNNDYVSAKEKYTRATDCLWDTFHITPGPEGYKFPPKDTARFIESRLGVDLADVTPDNINKLSKDLMDSLIQDAK